VRLDPLWIRGDVVVTYASQHPTPTLQWIIVGGEGGPGARPFDLGWARSVRSQCKGAGVAFFFKQGGKSNRCAHSPKGGCLDCIPEDLRVREFPGG
jgi:protein gp37